MLFYNEPPIDFNSDATNEPFHSCLICSEDLQNSGVPYTIEKAKKVLDGGEEVTLYELAICMPCMEQMSKRVSAHSRKVMDEFFQTLDMDKIREELLLSENPEEWKSKCAFSGKSKSEINEYNIVAQMVNGKLIYGIPPMLIDLKVLEPLQEKLSAETREEFNNFRDEFLAPDDPQLRALLEDSKFIFY
jgi:hypothetical protein